MRGLQHGLKEWINLSEIESRGAGELATNLLLASLCSFLIFNSRRSVLMLNSRTSLLNLVVLCAGHSAEISEELGHLTNY